MEPSTWVTLRMHPAMRDWIKAQAKGEHRTMQGYVLALLEREREKIERREQRQREVEV